jgi:hypothetical protein
MRISAISVLMAAPERKATKSAVKSGISSSTSARKMSSSAYCSRPNCQAVRSVISTTTSPRSAANSVKPGRTCQAVK